MEKVKSAAESARENWLSSEEDSKKASGAIFEINKISIQQMFASNWSAAIAVPTVSAILLEKNRIIDVIFIPLGCFLVGLAAAIGCLFSLTMAARYNFMEAEAAADRWAGEFIRATSGKIPQGLPRAEEMLTGEARARIANKRSIWADISSLLFSVVSFGSFFVGIIIFAYKMQV